MYNESNIDKFYSIDEILEEYRANQEEPAWDKNYLPIACDSSGNVFLLFLGEDDNYGKVYFANHEMFDPATDYFAITCIADNFDNFVNSLSPYEGKFREAINMDIDDINSKFGKNTTNT